VPENAVSKPQRTAGGRAVDATRFRTWAVLVPLHLLAFLALYVGTSKLLEKAYGEAGVEAARQRLEQVVREMPFFVPRGRGATNPHVFTHALAAHQDIDLELFGATGRPLGVGSVGPDTFSPEIRQFLASGEAQKVWLERWGPREIVHGRTRLIAGRSCASCHAEGTVLGAASMRIDYTAPLAAMRAHLRGNLALLLAVWVALLGLSATAVKLTVSRSAARLRADLDDAVAGTQRREVARPLVLDPVSAEVHQSLRDFLVRQHQREVELADRLAHVDQLAHLGELAAGLAHEIKNPLAGIQGALEVLRDDSRGDEEKVRLYEEMLSELRRVNTILQRLLESGRPAPLRLVRSDCAQLVRDTIDLLAAPLRRKQIALTAEVAPSLPALRLDPAKIRQVLVNLIQNAAEALDGRGGRITVRATGFPDGDGVVIAVGDDGPGIAPEVLDRVFQPFFTTKFTGTGLGLAISKSIIEQHGGRIEIDSAVEQGTTIYLFLPMQPVASRAPDEEG
jgi:signal transduction histidine kinase